MSEYAAHVGDNLLAVTSRILSVQPIVTGLGDTGNVLQGGQISMKIMTEVAQDATQGGLMRSTLPWFSDCGQTPEFVVSLAVLKTLAQLARREVCRS
jgi:hypothetical protein